MTLSKTADITHATLIRFCQIRCVTSQVAAQQYASKYSPKTVADATAAAAAAAGGRPVAVNPPVPQREIIPLEQLAEPSVRSAPVLPHRQHRYSPGAGGGRRWDAVRGNNGTGSEGNNASGAPESESCAQILGIPKVALMFLSRGEIYHERTWSAWFE